MEKSFMKKITEKLGRTADNIKASMREGASREQIKEYSSLEEAVLMAFDPKKLQIKFVEFETTREELLAFLSRFVKETITEETLRDKLLSAINDPTFILETYEGNGHRYGGVTGPQKLVGKNGKEYWSTKKQVFIGKNLGNGKIKTTFLHVRDFLHEAGHLSSQKYDPEWMNFSLQINPADRVKDHSDGEIESKFLEKIFCGYILQNAEQLCADNQSFGLTEEELIQQMVMLRNEDIGQFLSRLKVGKMSGTKDYKKSYAHRYVVGEVCSRLLCEEYKKNPQETIEVFSYYMTQNANITLDQAVKILSDGKLPTYGRAMDAFKELHYQKANDSETYL